MYHAPLDAFGVATVTGLDPFRVGVRVPRWQAGTDGTVTDAVLTAQAPVPASPYRPRPIARHAASSGQSRHVLRRATRSRVACLVGGIVTGSLAVGAWLLWAPDAAASHVVPSPPAQTVTTVYMPAGAAQCPTEDSCTTEWVSGRWIVREARP